MAVELQWPKPHHLSPVSWPFLLRCNTVAAAVEHHSPKPHHSSLVTWPFLSTRSTKVLVFKYSGIYTLYRQSQAGSQAEAVPDELQPAGITHLTLSFSPVPQSFCTPDLSSPC